MNTQCYMCQKQLDGANDHEEHIIPNGIGGKLKSYGILCKECGSRLGQHIDHSLHKKFVLLLNLLNSKTDRKLASASSKVKLGDIELNCYITEGHVYIATMHKDDVNKIIYCPPKSLESVSQRFGNTYKYITTLDHTLLDVDDLLILDEHTQLALCKIAVEYSIYCGLNTSSLELAFDINKKEFKLAPITSYYPFNLFEKFIENFKWYVEKQRMNISNGISVNSEFPTHSLKLFTNKNELYCLVSLFSYFEFYIKLSSNYQGDDLNIWHIESVVKTTPQKICYDLKTGGPKDIAICADHIGISTEEVIALVNANNVIVSKVVRTNYKKEDAAEYMLSIARDATDLLLKMNLYYKNPELVGRHIPLEVISCLDFVLDGKEENFMDIAGDSSFLFSNIDEEQEQFNMSRYKSVIYHKGRLYSIPDLVNEYLAHIKNDIDAYRRKQLHAVIAASELLYPTENEPST